MNESQEKRLVDALKKVDVHGAIAPGVGSHLGLRMRFQEINDLIEAIIFGITI